MRLMTGMFAGFGLAVTAFVPGQAAAQPKVYPYATSANFCPAGLQPISIAGVVCCGTPNQHMTYQQALTHPVKKHRVVKRTKAKPVYSARAHCPVGTKGCTYD